MWPIALLKRAPRERDVEVFTARYIEMYRPYSIIDYMSTISFILLFLSRSNVLFHLLITRSVLAQKCIIFCSCVCSIIYLFVCCYCLVMVSKTGKIDRCTREKNIHKPTKKSALVNIILFQKEEEEEWCTLYTGQRHAALATYYRMDLSLILE